MLSHQNQQIEGPHFSVRTRDHRLIAYRTGDFELYDHRTDPYEWNNLVTSWQALEVPEELYRHVPRREDCQPRNG